MALVDQYGRPLQPTPQTGTPGFGLQDVIGGEMFNRALNKAREAGSTAAEAVGSRVAAQGGAGEIARKGLNLAGRYAPLVGGGIQLLQGDPMGAAGSVIGGMLGAPLGPVASIAGAALGGPLLKGVAGLAGQAAQAATGAQREAGQSPGLIPGTSSGIGFSDSDIKRIEQLSKITGQSQVDIARQMLPVSNQYRDAEMQRQMQLNQQTGQITGALNRQMYMAQLAGGAQAQAGETTRTMMTAANPYAASAFQYRG